MVFVRAVKPEPLFSQGSYMTSEVDIKKIEENTKRIEDEKKSSAEAYLNQTVNRLGKHGEVKFQTAVVAGNVADSLIDYAEANDIDLILIATHGRSGVSRWVRGSIADRILRASSIPVLMVRAPGTMGE